MGGCACSRGQDEVFRGRGPRGISTAAGVRTGEFRDSFGLKELQLRASRLACRCLGSRHLARAGILRSRLQLRPPDKGELFLARSSINPGGLAQLGPPATRASRCIPRACLGPAGLWGAVSSQESTTELIAPPQHVLEGLLQGSPHLGAGDQAARSCLGLGPRGFLHTSCPPQSIRGHLVFQAGPCSAALALQRRLHNPSSLSRVMGRSWR